MGSTLLGQQGHWASGIPLKYIMMRFSFFPILSSKAPFLWDVKISMLLWATLGKHSNQASSPIYQLLEEHGAGWTRTSQGKHSQDSNHVLCLISSMQHFSKVLAVLCSGVWIAYRIFTSLFLLLGESAALHWRNTTAMVLNRVSRFYGQPFLSGQKSSIFLYLASTHFPFIPRDMRAFPVFP